MSFRMTNDNMLESKCVYLHETIDGKVDLSKFSFPDGEYQASILNYNGNVISKHNRVIKNGKKVQLLRRFEGSMKLSVAQTYSELDNVDNVNNKVLQFILEKCEDIRKIFIDVIPSMNKLQLEEFSDNNKSDNNKSGNNKSDNNKSGNNKSDNNKSDNNKSDNNKSDNNKSDNNKSDIDGTDINGKPFKFIDILKFYEKYIIVKGFMQVGKTKFIISSAVWHILNDRSSIIVLRNYNGDKDQLIRRVDEFNIELQKFLGKEFEDKFKIEALSNKNIKAHHLNGKTPKIIVCIANKSPLSNINKLIDNNPDVSKKFILYMDEVDYIDSEGTAVQNELAKIRSHAYCSFGVSATILDSTFKHDVDKGNVIILNTPEHYKSVVNFKFVHLSFDSNLVATIDGCVLNEDMNLTPYLDEFAEKKPYYVELYDEDEKGTEDDIRPECHHPVDSLLRVSICNTPNLRLLNYISTGYGGFPVMYFQGGTGAGKITAYIPGQNAPITLMNGSKSTIQNGIILDEGVKLDGGVYHIFNNASPALVKEWMKNKGGGVIRFPRIMTLAGGMAARCQSFGAADFNECLTNKTLAWHLTEMYMSASTSMDQPELIQTAGRLCVVARDNIQPLFYSSRQTCLDLIHAFQTQEELIERARNVQNMKNMGAIMKTVPIYHKKVIQNRPLTKKVDVKLNLVSEDEDIKAGGWSKSKRYCTKDKTGMILEPDNLNVEPELHKIITSLDKVDTTKDVIEHKSYRDQSEYIHKYLIGTRTTKISVFLSQIDPSMLYTRDDLIEFATVANYEQPNSIFLTITNPTSDWGPGCIFESVDGKWKVKSSLQNAWI